MADSLLGIDLGTSSVKAVLVDLEGRLLASASAAYPVSHPCPGWAETDPQLWWSAVRDAVGQVVGVAGATPVALGLSGQMHGLVATDAVGAVVRPALLWSDARAVDELRSYRTLPRELRSRLRNPLSPGMAGPLLAWLARHEPEAHAATRWALQPKDWLRARLTGQFRAEPSDASATLLYDLDGDRWDTDVVAALGLDPMVLAPLVASSAAPAGHLLPAVADELGLPAGLPVAAGAADTAAAALGSGLVEPGTAALTIGSGVQLVTPVPGLPAAPDADPVTHLYRAATDTGWYAMAAGLNAGLALDWVRTVLGASWPQLYAAAGTEPGLSDPVFLPHLAGERTPYLDPDMRGGWVGLAPEHDRTALLRSALEGVAFGARDALASLRAAAATAAPLTDLRLAGGGSTAGPWRQLLADVLGATLRPVDVAVASGRGAALLGARAAGLLDEREVLDLLPPAGDPAASPRADRRDFYDERHALYRRRVDALRRVQPTRGSGGNAA